MKAQAVPPYIGSPTPGCGYEDGDPYSDFLPPPVETDEMGNAEYNRAVVFVTDETKKETKPSGQEYANPLLVLTGEEYVKMSFDELLHRLEEAIRSGVGVVAEFLDSEGQSHVFTEDDVTGATFFFLRRSTWRCKSRRVSE